MIPGGLLARSLQPPTVSRPSVWTGGFALGCIPKKYIRSVGIYLSGLVLLCTGPVWAEDEVLGVTDVRDVPNSEETWSPELNNQADTADAAVQIILQHPRVDLAPAGYDEGFDIVGGLRQVPRLRSQLGNNFADLKLTDAQYLGVHFTTDGSKWKWNKEALHEARDELVSALGEIKLKKISNLSADLAALKNKRGEQKTLLKLAPFLYDRQGNAKKVTMSRLRPGLEMAISEMSHEDLETQFRHQWRSWYIDLASKALAQATGETRSSQKRRVEAMVNGLKANNALTPRDERPSKFVSIEEVHPLAALERNYWVLDCCGTHSRFYPLFKGVKSYAVRTSQNRSAKPDGYMLTYTYKNEDGKQVTYGIGFGGEDISEGYAAEALQLAARADGSDLLQYNKLTAHHRETNQSLATFGGSPAEWKAPKGWRTVGKFAEGIDDHGAVSDDYFNAEDLRDVTEVEVSEPSAWGPVHQESFSWVKPDLTQVKKIPTLTRALAVSKFSQGEMAGGLKRKLMDAFGVTRQEVAVAEPFVESESGEYPPLSAFHKLKRVLGADLGTLRSAMDIYSYGNLLKNYREEAPELATDKQWQGEFRWVQNQLRTRLVELEEGSEAFEDIDPPVGRSHPTYIVDLILKLSGEAPGLFLSDLTQDEALLDEYGTPIGDPDITYPKYLVRTDLKIKDRLELADRLIKQEIGVGRDRQQRKVYSPHNVDDGLAPFSEELYRDTAIATLVGLDSGNLKHAIQLLDSRMDPYEDPVEFRSTAGSIGLGFEDMPKLLGGAESLQVLIGWHESDPEFLPDPLWKRLFHQFAREARRDPKAQNDSTGLGFHKDEIHVPTEFSLIDFRQALRALDGSHYLNDELIEKFVGKEDWSSRDWQFVMELIQDPDSAPGMEVSEITPGLENRSWPRELFGLLANGVVDLAAEAEYSNMTHELEGSRWNPLLNALKYQDNWPIEVWRSAVVALEATADSPRNALRDRILRLIKKRNWPSAVQPQLDSLTQADGLDRSNVQGDGELAFEAREKDQGWSAVEWQQVIRELNGLKQVEYRKDKLTRVDLMDAVREALEKLLPDDVANREGLIWDLVEALEGPMDKAWATRSVSNSSLHQMVERLMGEGLSEIQAAIDANRTTVPPGAIVGGLEASLAEALEQAKAEGVTTNEELVERAQMSVLEHLKQKKTELPETPPTLARQVADEVLSSIRKIRKGKGETETTISQQGDQMVNSPLSRWILNGVEAALTQVSDGTKAKETIQAARRLLGASSDLPTDTNFDRARDALVDQVLSQPHWPPHLRNQILSALGGKGDDRVLDRVPGLERVRARRAANQTASGQCSFSKLAGE